ncbi:MAG: tetratricopeptide repeat protein [Candidatus Omnitrophica bacterium]|nr:tetratricopeptide repeat protein [Candidatus Omnitrophota bacterium]
MPENENTIRPLDIAESFEFSYSRKQKIIVSLLAILLATFLSYLPTLKNNFIFLDDDSHLLDNSAVRVLDAAHIKQMFTTTVSDVYVPLTFLTFAVEHRFFKYSPFIYHLDNLLLHLAVTSLVFAFALQAGLPLRAAFIAGLIFGIHPMHVESVSWVTERKDVLYSFFYMGALCFYWKYLTDKKVASYAATIILGLLSILSKPMALSLPLVLFACDWLKRRAFDRKMILDKIPHFAYVVSIAWITYSLNARIPGENIQSGAIIWIYTFVFYIRQFLFPFILVPMYALPQPIVLMNIHYAGSAALFLLIGGFLWRMRRHRWVIFAALYYFLSIFFLLRYDNAVDKNIVADRFMYLPCLGICFLLGYGMDRLLQIVKEKTKILEGILIACLILAAGWLGFKTFQQTQVWRASIPFWSYVLKYYPDNAMAFGNRGEAYKDQKEYELAMADFNASIKADPGYAESYNSRGQMHGMMGNTQAALEDFKKVIELRPNFDEAYNNIGIIYSMQNKPEEAVRYFEKAADIDPLNEQAQYNTGDYYYTKGDFDKAFDHFQKVIAMNPASAIAYNKRGLIYGIRKEYDLSIKDLNRALALEPNNGEFHKNKGVVLEHNKMLQEAVESQTKAIEINPKYADAYCFRGNAYAQMGRYGEAAKDFEAALKIDPDHWRAKQGQNALIEILTGQRNKPNPDVKGIITEEQMKQQRILDAEKKLEMINPTTEGENE